MEKVSGRNGTAAVFIGIKAILLRLTVVVGLALIIALPCLYPFKQPRIVFAWGYADGLHLFQQLNDSQSFWTALLLKGMTYRDLSHNSWDGQRLYVSGRCLACGKPYAPRGAFVLAILPDGFAYSTQESPARLSHLSVPIHISRVRIMLLAFLTGATLAFLGLLIRCARMWGRRRWLVAPGHCGECGYNLTGNISGVCPECAHPVPERPARGRDQA